MVHLMVHIVPGIQELGPAFLHEMYALERFNGVVKRFVRNRSQPDGSIIQGYLTEECIDFCTDFMAVEKPIGVAVSSTKAGWVVEVTDVEQRIYTCARMIHQEIKTAKEHTLCCCSTLRPSIIILRST